MLVYEFKFRQHTIVLILDAFFCRANVKSLATAVEQELRNCTRATQAMSRIKQRLPVCWFEGYYTCARPAGGVEYTLVCSDVEKGGGDWSRWRQNGHPVENAPPGVDIAHR